MSFLVNIALCLLKVIIWIYDMVPLPFWWLYYRPWRKTKVLKSVRATPVSSSDEEITFRAFDKSCSEVDDMKRQKQPMDTMKKLLEFSFHKFSTRRCLGTRHVREAVKEDNKLKLNLSSHYKWITYDEAVQTSQHFGAGMRLLGLESGQMLVVYADTRADWLMAAMACFKFNIILVTIYTNLGPNGVKYCLDQTLASFMLVSQELLPQLYKLLPDLTHISTLIVLQQPHLGPVPQPPAECNISIHTFEEVVELGKTKTVEATPPGPEDTGVIMYTSGSTGDPKGVILTQRSLAFSTMSLMITAKRAMGKVLADETYVAYLPLAHVLELLGEFTFLFLGAAVGYSSPATLTDTSPAIMAGQKGDLSVLRPSLMCAVPVILDRVYRAMNKRLDESGPFKGELVRMLINYRAYWVGRGYDTPLVNRLIIKKMKAALGGRVRLMLCGGAPLSAEVHHFIRNSLAVSLHQGYGLTETCAVACIVTELDLSTGRVGPPLPGVDLKLINWDEGGYRVKSPRRPCGEIVIGGENVAKGYYHMPEKTQEDFFDENNKRWFRTGDIGMVHQDGTLQIIDRKKDLVKLQMGEYVSLGKVETALKMQPIIESVCVCARPTEKTTVAIIVPDQMSLMRVASQLGLSDSSRQELCRNPLVNKELLRMVSDQAAASNLEKFEVPKAVYLSAESWTPQDGLVTAALKLKRKNVESVFKVDIDRMYESVNQQYIQSKKPPAISSV